MTSNAPRRSPLAVVLLALLAEAPMHPYRMQQLIKERGKDQVANVAQRNSVYQTIERLLRLGLIGVRETARQERRPERTVYEITDSGRDTLRSWMRAMLSTRPREFPEFPAALAAVMLLEPDDVLRQLRARAATLEAEVAGAGAGIPADLPRVFLLDDEYRTAMAAAELRWVRSVIDDLRSGKIMWSQEWLRQYAESGH